MHPQKNYHYTDIAFILLFHFLNPYPIFPETTTHAVGHIPSEMGELLFQQATEMKKPWKNYYNKNPPFVNLF